ncbi:MAG: DUF819 family protein, partial [Pirellulales bacterium]|nr:DUF819 family protein [Pirellulales bacterium]
MSAAGPFAVINFSAERNAMESAVTSEVGILVVLTGVSAFFFYLEKRTAWRFFTYFPPLLFIYAVPMVLANAPVVPVVRVAVAETPRQDGALGRDAVEEGVEQGALAGGETPPAGDRLTFEPLIPSESPVYGWMGRTVLPLLLILMLVNVDLLSTVRVLGRGIFVMLAGAGGVIVGAPIAYLLVKSHMYDEAWKSFGALSGSWIGGAGNMAAVMEGLGTSPQKTGLPILADTLVYVVWIPVLLVSKSWSGWFNRFARVDPKRIEMIETASASVAQEKEALRPRHVLYWLFLGLAGAWVAGSLAPLMPTWGRVLTADSWNILFITTIGILLSFTPARRIPGTHEVATAMVFLFMANMGAKANLGGLAGEAPWFIMAAFVWITIHGVSCVIAAHILHVDLSTMAIASAANIGGVATASIVAEHHNEKLLPAAVLMALA